MFPPLYLSRTCSVFAPLRFRHFPPPFLCNDAFISPYPHRYYVARACLSPPTELAVFFYSALSARMHHVRPSLCLEPRSPFSPVPRCIHLFSLTLVARHITLLHVSVPLSPNVPMSVRLFDYVSLAFPYLTTYLRARHWLMADSDCPFPLRRSPSCRSLCALFYCSD